jgi:hypothetical protein
VYRRHRQPLTFCIQRKPKQTIEVASEEKVLSTEGQAKSLFSFEFASMK